MSTEEKTRSWAWSPLGILVITVVSLAIIALAVKGVLNSIHRPPARNITQPAASTEESLERAREALARSPDLAGCKAAVQHLDDYLNRASDTRPETLTDAQRTFLQKQLQLEEKELEEIGGGSFTPLDAHYLDLCLLSRDALRALRGQDDLGKSARSPEQTAAAFAWVVRQVRLVERPPQPFPPHFMVRASEIVPPQFILRRGEGLPVERALIFLALLQQLDIPGCLLLVPGESGPQLWACGALLDREGGPQILVFDPRLGLALPGPDGQGVATLAQLKARPELLKQLTVDEKHPYDVTPEQAQRAEILFACPLTALAPRTRYLQDKLADTDPAIRAPATQLRLAVPAEDQLGRFRAAAGPETPVRFAADLARLQRSGLPAEEGGADRSDLLTRFRSEMVPWRLLPEEIQNLQGQPGQRLQSHFGLPFLTLWMEPRKPRDLMLRGQFTEASLDLVALQDELRVSKTQTLADNWREQMGAWREKINAAQAGLLRAQRAGDGPAAEAARKQVDTVWQEGGGFLVPLIQSRSVETRGQQASYLLALSKLEQAEQLQVRLQRSAETGRKGEQDRKAAAEAWRAAAQCWESFADEYSDSRLAPAARRLHARCRLMLGEKERAAVLLEDLTGNLTDLEKTAHLYLARQLRSPAAPPKRP